MRNIFKSAAVATLLTGLVILIGAIALAKPAFAQAVPSESMVSDTVVETVNPLSFLGNFKNSNPAPTPGAVVLFGLGSVMVFSTQRKFAKV